MIRGALASHGMLQHLHTHRSFSNVMVSTLLGQRSMADPVQQVRYSGGAYVVWLDRSRWFDDLSSNLHSRQLPCIWMILVDLYPGASQVSPDLSSRNRR